MMFMKKNLYIVLLCFFCLNLSDIQAKNRWSINPDNDPDSLYKRQNKLFHFHKTFCSEFDIINTKQNVHFTKVVSPIFQFCLSLHQFSIGAKVPFINKRD